MNAQLPLVESACAPFKRCGCGAAYSYPDWQRLVFAGIQHTEDEDTLFLTELRHCSGCLSTLALEWRIRP